MNLCLFGCNNKGMGLGIVTVFFFGGLEAITPTNSNQ